MKTKNARYAFILGGLLSAALMSSCRKEHDTLAQIRVLDMDGNPFPGAQVRLFGEPTINPHPQVIIDRTLFTDADGEVIFDFTKDFNLGQGGFAVLTIEVNSGDSLSGEGIIKIEEEKLNAETVIIQMP